MLRKLDKEDVFMLFDSYYDKLKKHGYYKVYQIDFFRHAVKMAGVSGKQHTYIKDYFKEWKQKMEG